MFRMQKPPINIPKVIKVVNLKRFIQPAAHSGTRPKLKRVETSYSPVVSQEYLNTDVRSQEPIFYYNAEAIAAEDDETNNKNIIDKSNRAESDSQLLLSQLSSSKIMFRSCSHTTEELSTLHECVDETLVKIGDTFDSRDSFKQYLNDNAQRWHYYYVCRNSKKRTIEYDCICMAYNNKQKEVVIRKQKKRTTACPCKIRLMINKPLNKLIVYYVCNHHDHPTTASAFYHYPHAKHLPQQVKEEFLDLTYSGLEVELIQKYIHSLVGLTIKKKDIWSYTYRFKRNIFKRSISNNRQQFIDDLIIKIRNTYGQSLNTKEKQSQHFEVVLSIKDGKSESKDPKQDSTINSLVEDTSINYSNDSLLKEVLSDTPLENTEVIVQHVNEDGILCDENGDPITNSSATMQFINNYAYVAPEQDLQETVFSELVDNQEEIVNWVQNSNMVFEIEPSAECDESAVLNDIVEDQCFDATVETECLEQDIENGIIDRHEKRLTPTPNTPPVYAEMDIFKKYYYVDHRYIPCEKQNTTKKSVVQCNAVRDGGIDTGPISEEFIKAPDFVYHPTPIRHCAGHDSLTLLTDSSAVVAGAKFLTHDVFRTYVNERAGRWFFYYSLMESGRVPEYYVYKCVYGKARVSRNHYRAQGLRKRNKLTTQCPCLLRLRRLEADPAYLTVLYSCNHHDHELSPEQFALQPHSRRLPPAIKEEVKDLLTLGVSTDVLRKYVLAETGVRVYSKYFHNVRLGLRRAEQRHYCEERLRALTNKIRDLEAIYGSGAKENPQARVQNLDKQRKPPLSSMEDPAVELVADDEEETAYERVLKRLLLVSEIAVRDGASDAGQAMLQHCELSESFADEIYIMEADSLHTEDSAYQSRLETRLQRLSHKEILRKVRKFAGFSEV